MSKLRRWVGIGLLALILVMPFHAFLSVWLGSATGHQALWQAWKEVVLLLAVVGTAILAWQNPEVRRRLKQPLLILIYSYVFLGITISVLTRPGVIALAYGIKTDLEFLVAFVVSYAVAGPRLAALATKLLIAGTAAVGLIGTLQAFILPKDFLAYFGYGPHTIMPFENLTSQVSSFRILSTLGGPNQLGSYLVLPICLLVALMIRRWRWWQPVVLALAIISLWHTYSRSAWLAALLAVGMTLAIETPARYRRKVGMGGLAAAVVLGAMLIIGVARHTSLESYVLHGSLRHYVQTGSDAQRLQSQRHGLALIRQRPLGRGLGTAGPASKYGANYTVTENNYLQLGVELGLVGLLLFVAIEMALAWRLWPHRKRLLAASPLISTLAGISLINFFLHGWADSSTAMIFWTYAGLALGSVYTEKHHAA